jgi:hypothetical protein
LPGDEAELRGLHRAVETGAVIGTSPLVQQRIRYFQQKVTREKRALRALKLHPDRFDQPRPHRRAAADRYLLTPNEDPEAIEKSNVWAGD